MLANHYPEVDIVAPATKEVVQKGRKNTSPDQIMFNAVTDIGVAFNFHLQTGAIKARSFRSTHGSSETSSPHLDWRIFGSKGEIHVSSPGTWPLNAGTEDWSIEVLVLDEKALNENQVKEVGEALNLQDELGDIPKAARNIGRLYEAFAESGTKHGTPYPTFDDALKKHQIIEDMYRQSGF